MKKMIFVLGLIASVGMGVAGCYNDNTEELYPTPTGAGCDTNNVTFATLQPIINNQCATNGCHAGPVPSGIDLRGYDAVKVIADDGRLMRAINHTGPSPMPKGMAKLDPCVISKFQAWINKNEPQ